MIIKRAIVATDQNPLYYEFWPLVAKGWRNAGIEATVAVIGELNLNYAFGTVVRLPGIEGIPTGFIAQVIRLIIPCFFPEEVSVTGDMDMIPLNRNYFQGHISAYSDDNIVVFSADAYKNVTRYPICYIAAKGKYFQQLIGLHDLRWETISDFIKDLFALNKGWDTDELFFAGRLHQSPLLAATIFLNRGGWAPFAKNRIDRGHWRYFLAGLCTERYIDAHCVRPLHENRKALQAIIHFLEQGSVGKRYLAHLLKRPVKFVCYQLRLLRQNHFTTNLYNVSSSRLISDERNKAIAFSLYGNNPRYVENLEAVIQSYRQFFPGWKCRVYTAKDVLPATQALLSALGCEVVLMNAEGVNSAYMNWRYLAIGEEHLDAAVFRDLDSYASLREKIMVDQWLESGKTVHIIRDHVNHNVRMMGGMWGIRKSLIDIRKESRKIVMVNAYGMDQRFLEQLIFPLIKDDVLVHDSYPRYPDERPVIIPLMPGENFVGEINTDDAATQRDREFLQAHSQKYFSLD